MKDPLPVYHPHQTIDPSRLQKGSICSLEKKVLKPKFVNIIFLTRLYNGLFLQIIISDYLILKLAQIVTY